MGGFQDSGSGKSQVEPVRVIVDPCTHIGGKLVLDVLLGRQLGVYVELVQLRISDIQHMGAGLEPKAQIAVPGYWYGIGEINSEIGFRGRADLIVHYGESQTDPPIAHGTVYIEGLGLWGTVQAQPLVPIQGSNA